MNRTIPLVVCLAAEAISLVASSLAVQGGTASFVVNTTVPGISVKGKSTALEAHATLERVPEGLKLENIHASLPVRSFATGMSLRDEHMRRYIFTTAQGTTPDLRFDGVDSTCAADHGSDVSCKVSGELSIRGVARPFTITLKLKTENAAYHASGDALVKLSDYGIEQPSQFGVKTANDVQLHLELNGKAADTIADGGRR